jgi:hypothetical protein
MRAMRAVWRIIVRIICIGGAVGRIGGWRCCGAGLYGALLCLRADRAHAFVARHLRAWGGEDHSEDGVGHGCVLLA